QGTKRCPQSSRQREDPQASTEAFGRLHSLLGLLMTRTASPKSFDSCRFPGESDSQQVLQRTPQTNSQENPKTSSPENLKQVLRRTSTSKKHQQNQTRA